MDRAIRPTREEAMRRGHEVFDRGSRRLADTIDAVAALFGGFASDPVEVPRLHCSMRIGPNCTPYPHPLASEPGKEWTPNEAQGAAAFARSNAWERIKAYLEQAMFLAAEDGIAGHTVIGEVSSALRIICDEDKMGIGPRVTS